MTFFQKQRSSKVIVIFKIKHENLLFEGGDSVMKKEYVIILKVVPTLLLSMTMTTELLVNGLDSSTF